jgi:hypothetical protein
MNVAATGAFGTWIAVLTVAIVGIGAVCAAARARRIAGATVLLAAVLPLGVGLLGVLWGRQEVLRAAEMMRAPTMADLEASSPTSHACLVVGIAAAVVCAIAGGVAMLRAPTTSGPPPAA